MALLAVPTLMLLWVNARALWREWFPAESPSTLSRSVEPEQLATALERRTSELALDALSDRELTGTARSGSAQSERRQFRATVVNVRRRHPVVRNIFIVRNRAVEFPSMRAPAPMSRSQYIAEYGSKQERPLDGLLAAADQRQRVGRYSEALAILERAESIALAAPLRALILQNRAECFRRLGLQDEAESTYTKLATQYGDVYSPEGIPWAITASLARDTIGRAELQSVYDRLTHGQWELSAEQVAQLQAKFRSRPGNGALPETSDYLDEFDMARSLQRAVSQPVPAQRLETKPQPVPDRPGLFALAFAGRTNYQGYYRTITRANGEKVLLGLTVDLEWLQQTVCPELGIGNAYELGYSRDAVVPTASTPFKTAFHFWNLRPVTTAARQSAAQLEKLIAISSEVLAAILCFGLFVLHRHIARERETIRMRSDFVSAISHELKTPITVIRLYSETLFKEPDIPPEVREYCEIVSHEAQRLGRLVDGVLSFSSIERGVKKYHPRQCDVGALTMQVLADMRGYYYQKGYTLSEDVARDLPPVSVDEEAFRSALLNLVDNAVKYSGDSHVVRVSAYRGEDSVEVAVEDNGTGIAPDALDKIFHPFFRADHAAAQGGCGLGLYLVRHVMTAHGGSVRVKSTVGQGSRFELVFPAIKDAVVTKPDVRLAGVPVGESVNGHAA